VIVLPASAAQVKVDHCRWWGAEIAFYDPETEDRVELSRGIAESRAMTLIPPFDDLEIMAGQGTAGLELADQLRQQDVTPDAVVIPCSGGGLSSGVTEAMTLAYPHIASFIVERDGYDKKACSLASGAACRTPDATGGILGAIGGPVVGKRPLAALGRHDVAGLTISEQEALDAVSAALRLLKIVEPAGPRHLPPCFRQSRVPGQDCCRDLLRRQCGRTGLRPRTRGAAASMIPTRTASVRSLPPWCPRPRPLVPGRAAAAPSTMTAPTAMNRVSRVNTTPIVP
jgi:hypothetical protein